MKGESAEKEALGFLQKMGLRFLEKNYRTRFGEIDLILKDGSTIVFVEVRSRALSGFGNAAESITPKKQQRIIKAAKQYLAGLHIQPDCRFDAVLYDGERVQWIKNAFYS